MLFNSAGVDCWLCCFNFRWQLLTNSRRWRAFILAFCLMWWQFCQQGWLKAWIIHAWTLTGIILFLRADRNPFTKCYYTVTWRRIRAIFGVYGKRCLTSLCDIHEGFFFKAVGILPGLLPLFVTWLHMTLFKHLIPLLLPSRLVGWVIFN